MLCCIFCCLPAPQADLTRFRRVIVRWVSTAKRKTRLHADFRSARRSKWINPLKITLPTQFLRRIEEEMLKVHVSSLATQFGPQRLRYDTFISRLLRSQHSLRVAVPSIWGKTGGRERLWMTQIVLCDVIVIYVMYVNYIFRERASILLSSRRQRPRKYLLFGAFFASHCPFSSVDCVLKILKSITSDFGPKHEDILWCKRRARKFGLPCARCIICRQCHGIMCILCTPRPIYRSTYRPSVDRYVSRHSPDTSLLLALVAWLGIKWYI